ncbi:MAG: ABC transporter ATP-binding protein [Myxococcales bacterium]|nr:ABC transporter ATP-binding protein [Myxococcales bacterium]
MSPPLLSLERIGRTYRAGGRHVRALEDVSLSLHAGARLVLVGESGSGKSTLARVAARHEAPDQGRVLYEGVDVTLASQAELRPWRRFVQLVLQDPDLAIDPRYTLRAAIREPLVVQGWPDDGAGARLAALVGLSPALLDAYPHQASGGQKQRAVLARALALSPRVLVLDEPTAALDASAAAHVLELLLELQDRLRIGLLLVTHDLRVARFFATEVAVLHQGRVVEGGPPERVLDDPQHPITRALVDAVPPAPAGRAAALPERDE